MSSTSQKRSIPAINTSACSALLNGVRAGPWRTTKCLGQTVQPCPLVAAAFATRPTTSLCKTCIATASTDVISPCDLRYQSRADRGGIKKPGAAIPVARPTHIHLYVAGLSSSRRASVLLVAAIICSRSARNRTFLKRHGTSRADLTRLACRTQ